MSNYKEASRLGLRFQTIVGNLTVEQLWGLSLTNLSSAIKAVKKTLKKTDDDELSFLEDSKVINTVDQLKFDILKDVYLTKKGEMEALRDAANVKEHNNKIDTIIAAKKETELQSMSVEQLEALRK